MTNARRLGKKACWLTFNAVLPNLLHNIFSKNFDTTDKSDWDGIRQGYSGFYLVWESVIMSHLSTDEEKFQNPIFYYMIHKDVV